MTCAALDDGHHPAVITAIMKEQATERMRVCVNDAMDVHGGKAIIEGPLNYLGSLYRGVPIGITVEGANIVTRSPHSIRPGRDPLPSLSPERNDGAGGYRSSARPRRIRSRLLEPCRSQPRQRGARLRPRLERRTVRAGARTRETPRSFYRQLGRYAAAFALSVDMALLTLAAALSARR